MANFEIPESPVYVEDIRKFETTDPAHADLFNAVFQAIINNIEYLKQSGKVKIGPADTELECGDTLFVVEGSGTITSPGIVYTNFTMSKSPPDTDNWGMLEGKLAVSEDAPPDAVFFAKIE